MGKVVHAANKHVRIIFRIFPKHINDVAISDDSNDYSIAEFQLGWLFPRLLATGRNSRSRACWSSETHPYADRDDIADKAMIVRSIVSHDGVCVEGCSSIGLRLYPSASSPWVAQANVRQITRGRHFYMIRLLSEISSGESRCPYATGLGDLKHMSAGHGGVIGMT